MADLHMSWSGDLSLTTTGDLTTVDQAALGTERVLRRLMTNPGDYIWNPGYGAGLAQYIGLPVDPAGIQALILSQMQLESAVAAVPEPVIVLQSDAASGLYAQISYADATTAQSTSVSVSLPEAN
jgi:phage baseplate assembly protein W